MQEQNQWLYLITIKPQSAATQVNVSSRMVSPSRRRLSSRATIIASTER
jgi:hypothetical protein